jgi:uncharacterized phage protein (TIGR02218 family)
MPTAGATVVTQVGAQTIGRQSTTATIRITQIGAQLIGTRTPCTYPSCEEWIEGHIARKGHAWARLWEVNREDGTDFYFTDHNGALDFGGNTYTPVGSFSASALEKSGGFKEHTEALRGAVSTGAIELLDVEARLWDNAKVTQRIVDWRYPWAGCLREQVLWIGELSWNGHQVEADVGGITSKLRGARGDSVSRNCTNEFGATFGDTTTAGCKYDLATATATGTVDGSAIQDDRFDFDATGLTADKGDAWYPYGKLTWLAGSANAGLVSHVRTATDEGSGRYRIVLEVETPFPIEGSDTFTLGPGCERTVAACTVYSQITNYRGAPYSPGQDGMQLDKEKVVL